MRWQKIARVVVALIGLGTAGAVYFLTRERPAASKAPLTTVVDPNATVQGGAGRDERFDFDKGRLIGTAEYASWRKYSDNRIQWDKFTYRFGNGAVVSADLVEGKGTTGNRDQPAELVLTGNVRFGGGDRGTLTGDAGLYNDTTGIATISGPATYSRGRMSGTGTGGTYERDTGAFKLLENTRVTMTSDEPGAKPIEATSQSMTYVPGGKAMVFDQHARIVRDAETLSGETAPLSLSEDEQRFRAIELRGNARVTPAAGKQSDLPDMQAGDIDLGFYEGSQALQRAGLHRQATMIQTTEQGPRSIVAPEISFTTAPDGKTLTHLVASGRVTVTLPASATAAGRTITASTLLASGNDKIGLTSAIFDGGSEFVESTPASQGRPSVKRTGKASKLGLILKGQLEAIDVATFERDTHFTSGEVEGDADIGEYRAEQGELDLRPDPRNVRKTPYLTTSDVKVEAREVISVNLNTTDVRARGDVRTVAQPRQTSQPARPDSVIFNGKDPLLGSGAEFSYEDSKGFLRYVGSGSARAQLKQGEESVVRANEIEFFQQSQDLRARGNVETTLSMAASAGAAESKSVATAGALDYSDGKRTAAYTGTPATLRRTDDETKANRVVLTLSAASRTLERMEAVDNVEVIFQGGRVARGAHLVYEAAKTQYSLSGKPVTILTRDADGTCSRQGGNFVTLDGALGKASFPPPPINPIGSTYDAKQPCPPAIAPKK